MDLLKLTGLEFLQAMERGEIPKATIAETIPMDGVLAEKGRIVMEAKANDRHLNPLGQVHGGFAATVLDAVTGCAVHTMLEPRTGFGTVDLNIKMMRPVPLETKLLAEGKIINMSKSLGVAEGTLKDEAGKLYAHATATCKIFKF